MKTLLFLPVKDSMDNLPELCHWVKQLVNQNVDSVLIIDNSLDPTQRAYLSKNLLNIENIDVIFNKENYGLGGSLKIAFSYAIKYRFDYLVEMHSNGAVYLDQASKLIGAKHYLEYDAYLGNRFDSNGRLRNYSSLRRFFQAILSFICSFLWFRAIPDLTGAPLNFYKVNKVMDRPYEFVFNFVNNVNFHFSLLIYLFYKRSKIEWFPCFHTEPEEKPLKRGMSQFVLLFLEIIYSRIFTYKYLNKLRSRSFDSFEYENISKKFIKKKEVSALRHDIKEHENILVVNWCLTNVCNYDCSYCPDSLHDGSVKGPEIETMTNFIDKVISHYNQKTIFFEFTGGEVTVYRHFKKLVTYIREKGSKVGIISNGSRPLKFWEEHLPYLDHICLSFHFERAKADHFFEVVKMCAAKITTHVNIMMKPSAFDECYKLAKDCAENIYGISLAIQPLLENMEGEIYKYTDEQREILDNQQFNFATEEAKYQQDADFRDFKSRGAMRFVYSDQSSEMVTTAELISKNLNNWENWYCSIGLENIVVDMFGNVKRGWCNVGGNFANISDKFINFPNKQILCNRSSCFCGLDILATKTKSMETIS